MRRPNRHQCLYAKIAVASIDSAFLRTVSRVIGGGTPMHVTLMLSDHVPGPGILADLKPVLDSRCTAQVTKVRWIAGHDKRGYVVADLDAVDLHDRHDLLTKIGCTPRWDEYWPHLTLAKAVPRLVGIEFARQINQEIGASSPTLMLERTTMSNTG